MVKKLELTKKEIKAVESSIRHWKRDIQAKLLKGKEIRVNYSQRLVWVDTNKEVKCYDDSCALCKVSGFCTNGYSCGDCPYYRKYGIECASETNDEIGHWVKFKKNPTLKTCNAMIAALEKILK